MEWYVKLGIGFIAVIFLFCIVREFSDQNVARNYGGEMEVSL